MRLQTIYDEKRQQYYLRRMILWKIPLGYYDVPELLSQHISDEETIHFLFRTHHVNAYCGVSDQSRILRAIERLRLIRQHKKLKSAIVVGEEDL